MGRTGRGVMTCRLIEWCPGRRSAYVGIPRMTISQTLSVLMARISISRVDQSPLEFDGELLVRSLSEADEHGRHYVVTIYRKIGERAVSYVPAVQYVSEISGEASFAIAEVIEDAADVEKFFYVFEPLEHLECDDVDAWSAQARQEFTQKLFRLYDGAVANALGKFQGQRLDGADDSRFRRTIVHLSAITDQARYRRDRDTCRAR